MIFASDQGSRPVGMPSRIAWLITVCCRFDFTSTVGEAPATVIVSCNAPTSSLRLTVAVKLALTTMSRRSTGRNPCSSNFKP